MVAEHFGGCYHRQVLAGTDRGFLYRVRVENLEPLMICENHSAPVTTIQYSKVKKAVNYHFKAKGGVNSS